MADKRSGFSAAVGEAIDRADPLIEEAEELDLFGDDPNWGSPVGESAFSQGTQGGIVRRRGPGRPAGATNISTRRMVEFLEKNYRHPLLGLADVAATPPHELAQLILPRDEDGEVASNSKGQRYELSKDDMKWAFDLWFRCTTELAEYMSTKQPRQLVAADGLPPVIQLNLGSHQGGFAAVMDVPMGMPETSMITTHEEIGHDEVPQSEVPQGDAPAANTGDPELSGS